MINDSFEPPRTSGYSLIRHEAWRFSGTDFAVPFIEQMRRWMKPVKHMYVKPYARRDT